MQNKEIKENKTFAQLIKKLYVEQRFTFYVL